MSPHHAKKLFQPYDLGDIHLANRIVMAPLTRNRATPGTDAPNDLMVDYYWQRASAGLIITEASQISQQGQGYIHTPGIYTDEQASGWRRINDAAHEAGSRTFIQLWHVGRVSHVSLQPGGGAPVAPSAIRANTKTFVADGFVDVSEPRALDLSEIPGIVADYARAAGLAKDAGFDGVEIHAANGYLLDQFQKDGSNHRTDSYGGSIENRCRLTLEVVDAIAKILPPGRIGIRLSPVSPANDVRDSNPQAVFDYLVRQLDARKLAYIHVIEGATGGARDVAPFDIWRCARLSAVPISPIIPAIARWRWKRWKAARPTSSPSGDRSSPIPTSSSACAATPRSIRWTRKRSMAAAPKATPTTPPSPPEGEVERRRRAKSKALLTINA